MTEEQKQLLLEQVEKLTVAKLNELKGQVAEILGVQIPEQEVQEEETGTLEKPKEATVLEKQQEGLKPEVEDEETILKMLDL